MSREDGSPLSIFVRFKQHVDAALSSALDAVVASPATPGHQPQLPIRETKSTSSAAMDPFNIDVAWSEAGPGDLSSIAFSSYSPLNLRSLPQPVPNDAPPDAHANIFTFEDAFEDLLAVSKGQPLPEIASRYQQRQLLRTMFPDGEPAWFWMRRLRAQGLVDPPNRGPLFKFSSSPDWDSFHRELDRRAANAWRAATSDMEGEAGDGGLISDLGRLAKMIEQGFRGLNNAIDNPDPQERQPQQQVPREPRGPDSFDELSSSIQSTFAEGQKSWDAFIKAITEHPSATHEGRETARGSKGGNQTVVKDEHVDQFGYLHSKITSKTFDDDGNEIGTETRISVRPADKHPDTSGDGWEPKHTKDDHHDVKSGWFWK